jgi:mannosyltransferase OCH1-like enzyme
MNVWVYWEGYKPPYIDLCISTIKKYSSGLGFVMLDDRNVSKYLYLQPSYYRLSVVHKADYIRVALLNKYGGCWIDADTIVLKPISKYLKFLDKYRFLGFGKPRSPSNSIIAGRTDSFILKLWLSCIISKMGNKNIGWAELGSIPLKGVLKRMHNTDGLEYYNISSEYCVPVVCKDWRMFFSNRIIVSDVISPVTGFVMLYNKFMCKRLMHHSMSDLMKSDILLSKLFRKAIC